MRTKKYRECKWFVLRGFGLLLLGSALLLTRKLPLPEPAGNLCVLAGALALLLGNGLILFGLLVFADARKK